MATVNGVLGTLVSAGNLVTLGVEVAGQIIPLVRGTIAEIKDAFSGQITVTYANLVLADQAELDAIAKMSTDDLAAINAELARLGLPPVQPPSAA